MLPGASLVASGPYRMPKHPNYFFVAAEMVIVPLALWMRIWAALFFVFNVITLPIRIRILRPIRCATLPAPTR